MQQFQSPWSPTSPSTASFPGVDRECLVPGCHKKHCYARVDGGKIYSRYCYRHTCGRTVSVQDGYHCPMQKEEGDRYCQNHMTCAADNCRQTGAYPDDSFPWFCPQHRCSKPDCTSGTHNLLSKHCTAHLECAALQCFNPPHLAALSSFCRTHTCTFGNNSCSLQAVSGNRCAEHAIAKCGLPACTSTCVVLPSGKTEPFCAVHMEQKCAKLGCGGRKLHPQRRYCLDHGCRVLSCKNERYTGGGTLCAVHKCTFDACFEVIERVDDVKSLFCAGHACKKEGCLFSRKRPGVWCEQHGCTVEGCLKERPCVVHDGRCKVGGCEEGVSSGKYCGRHVCVEDDCGRARLSVTLVGEDGDGEMVRCLKHDRENLLKERDEWRRKYEELKMGRDAKDGERERKRSWRQATVEDPEDAEDW